MRLEFLPWLILLLPLAAAVGITLFTLPDRERSARLSIGAVLASFALTGPEKCSGLPVQRYSAETLQAALGPVYRLLDSQIERHATPAGGSQDFLWCLFRKD